MISVNLRTWKYFFPIFSSLLFFFLSLRVNVNAHLVNITYVQSAISKGAVCLDGSPPAYHFSPGFGSGNNNWLVSLQGGGWCNNVTTCLSRKVTAFGSSKYMTKQAYFAGILSNNPSLNPDFYNWNIVKVLYCDGSSFTGDVEIVDPATKLNYRGARIWNAVMDDLLSNGMNKAENTLLTGESAGGLASILHCDKFSALFTSQTHVKCLSDGGFFVNLKDISGTRWIENYYNDVVTTHGSSDNLPSSCTSKLSPSLCFFPENVVQNVETPLFILNSAYDSWQINNVLIPSIADPNDLWCDCKINIKYCSSSQLDIFQGFREGFLNALYQTKNSTLNGLFINSCFVHVQSISQDTWLSSDSPILNNTRIAKAVGDWFFDRRDFEEIDCAYPCDNTCINEDYYQPVLRTNSYLQEI